MKNFSLISALLVLAVSATGCAPAMFGKMSQKDNWHGFMRADTFMKYREHDILMERQGLALEERRIALAERDSALAREARGGKEVAATAGEGIETTVAKIDSVLKGIWPQAGEPEIKAAIEEIVGVLAMEKSQGNKQSLPGRNRYPGQMANEMGATRSAHIIEVFRISQENYRELGVIHSLKFQGRTSAVINLPEGYYIVKWYDGDFLTQVDRIQALPHRTVDVVKKSGEMEEYNFFSYCKR
ncbi:MAG: hypothetical protein PHR36_00825 [Patescibacteria group bacterium]|nr:hypothetical protein [Patescibacteria group bacterium]